MYDINTITLYDRIKNLEKTRSRKTQFIDYFGEENEVIETEQISPYIFVVSKEKYMENSIAI